MLKKTIKFKDLEGNDLVEDFYFHLSKTELVELDLEMDGGLKGIIERIIKEQDNLKIFHLFKMIIRRSYGERHVDGRRFVKSEDLAVAFLQTDAWEQMFLGFLTDAEDGAKFIQGIVPVDLLENVPVQEVTSPLLNTELEVVSEAEASGEQRLAEILKKEPINMTKEELVIAMQAKLSDR